MCYLDKDVAHFVTTSPYLTLAKPRSAAGFLRRQIEIGEECLHVLRRYPDVRIEPLEFFYTCLRSLGALDQPFFEALVRDHTWRGVVWGSWLAMLEPRDGFVEALRAARPGCPHNEWIVDCALAAIEGGAARTEVGVLAERCRWMLAGVPRPEVPLRLRPTATEIALMDGERARIRAMYASEGTDAALGAVRGTLVGFYVQDYGRWVRSKVVRRNLGR